MYYFKPSLLVLLVLISFMANLSAQNVGIGNTAPTNALHVTPTGLNDPIRIEGLNQYTIERHLFITDPNTGVVKHMHVDSLASVVSNLTGDDNQNIDSLTLNGVMLTAHIENGASSSVNLQSLIDSAVANSTNTDNQNIDSLVLNGTLLTTYIQNGTSSSVNLQAIVDSAIANSTGDNDWNINPNGTGLEGNPGVNVANGTNSIAAGDGNIASGDYSVAFGINDSAIGRQSIVAGGIQNKASGTESSVLGGFRNKATANFTTVGGGLYNVASAYGATVTGGNSNNALGRVSNVSGIFNSAHSFAEWVGGMYASNYTPNSTFNYNANDRLFVVGNGTSITNRSNALTLFKDGRLEINEAYILPNTDGSNNQVLTTNGSGTVSWQAASGGDSDWDINANGTGLEGNPGTNVASGTNSIAAGNGNTSSGINSISLGLNNNATGINATISGGNGNTASGRSSFVGGGFNNTASGANIANTNWGYAVVVGGYGNSADEQSAVVGGRGNTATNVGFVGGGRDNNATSFGWAFIGGGQDNTASGIWSVVGGGELNTASASLSTIGGGLRNETIGVRSTVAGGYQDSATGENSFVGGGYRNKADGLESTVSGGRENKATGRYSAITGGRVNKAPSYGELVGGIYNTSYTPISTTTFNANDRIFTIGNGTAFTQNDALVILKNGNATLDGTLTQSSDKNLKKDIKPLENSFDKITAIGGYTYNWKDQEHRDNRLQIGLIAQEVQKEFPNLVSKTSNGHLGVNYISLIPVMVEAFKEQQKINNEQKNEIENLKQRLIKIENLMLKK